VTSFIRARKEKQKFFRGETKTQLRAAPLGVNWQNEILRYSKCNTISIQKSSAHESERI
jgi:hypothetical protein